MIRTVPIAVLLALALTVPGVAAAESSGPFCKTKAFTVRSGETHTGDVYTLAANIDVSGVQDGDLIAMAQVAVLSGEVNGDVVFFGQSIDISGTVSDSVRIWANGVTVTGTIDGDLIVFGNQVNLHPRGHVTGNMIVLAGSAIVEGQVDGDLRFTGGKVAVGGSIGRNATIEADGIDLDPQARIAGDLEYTARKALEIDTGEIVGGEVRFEEDVDESDEEPGPFITASSVFWWFFWTLAATMVGLVAVALFRRVVPAIVTRIEREAMMGALVGFGIFFVVPAAAILAVLVVIALPLGVITLALFAVALYLAKVPVALWIGGRLLAWTGRSAPSPFLALVLGMPLLYLLFELPYLGFLVWVVTTWLGLGSIVLTLRTAGPQAAAALAGNDATP